MVPARGRAVPSWKILRLMAARAAMTMGMVLAMAEATPVGRSVASMAFMGAIAKTGPMPKVVTEKSRVSPMV